MADRSSVHVVKGKSPLVINLDDEVIVPEREIEVVIIEESFCDEISCSERPNVEKIAPVLVDIPSESVSQDSSLSLGMQRLCDYMCRAKLSLEEEKIEKRQLRERLPKVGREEITGTKAKKALRQPLKEAKLNPKQKNTRPVEKPASSKLPTFRNALGIERDSLQNDRADGTVLTNKCLRNGNSKEDSIAGNCKAKLSLEEGKIEKRQLRERLPNVGYGEISGTKPKMAVRQPLKEAKLGPKQKNASPVKKSACSELPTFHSASDAPQNDRADGIVLTEKCLGNGNCKEKNSGTINLKKKKRNRGRKRKADSADVSGGDETRPSKSVKLVPDKPCTEKLNPVNSTSKLNVEQTVAIPHAKPNGKVKRKWKKKRKARRYFNTKTGLPVAAEDSSTVQVHHLSSTNEFRSQPSKDSVPTFGADFVPITPVHDDNSEQQRAPLGSCINPILITDFSFALDNDSVLSASTEKDCSKNQKQVEVSSPEIEVLCVVTPTSSSSLQKSVDVCPKKILPKNDEKKSQCLDVELTAERISINEQVQASNFLFGGQPAGPFHDQHALPVVSNFTSANSVFGIQRTVFNDFISNNGPPNRMQFTASSIDCTPACSSKYSNLILNVPQFPAPNFGNILPGQPLGQIWANLVAEQAELLRRASSNVSSNSLPKSNLRPVAIDGSNVAFSHGKDKVFSTRGIEICIDFFRKRGHTVKAFVPQFRRKAGYSVQDQPLLEILGRSQDVVFTPSRDINGINVVCYDDRFVLEYAARTGAVIVSNDNYRDLMRENPLWKEIINSRLLMYSFADNHFLVPEDPLGRHGPKLDQFLRF